MTLRSHDDLIEQMRREAADICTPAELMARRQLSPRRRSRGTVGMGPGHGRIADPRWLLATAAAVLVLAIVVGVTALASRTGGPDDTPATGGPDRTNGASAPVRYQGLIKQHEVFGINIIANPPGDKRPKVTWQQVLLGCNGCADRGRTTIHLASVSTPEVGRVRHGRVMAPRYDNTLAYIVISRHRECGSPIGGVKSLGTTQAPLPTTSPSFTCTFIGVYSADTGKFGFGISD